MSVEERFWSKVDRDGPVPSHRPDLGPCWLWTGASAGRYPHGQLNIGGRHIYAHRLSFEWEHGPLDPGMNALHHCDEGLCVRPAHLFAGTQADNLADMALKGRSSRLFGELSPSAKLDWAAVTEVRSLYEAGGHTHRSLAIRFGVSHTAVGDVLRGATWQQLS